MFSSLNEYLYYYGVDIQLFSFVLFRGGLDEDRLSKQKENVEFKRGTMVMRSD